MKTAVLTGSNSGVGKAAAIVLAKKGYKVIIHGRDAAKTKQAADEVKSASGSKEVDHVVADISEIKGMRAFADAVKQKTNVIDALVLSTGVILPKYVLTGDQLEAGFAIQYLSRFAAVQMLMPELKAGKAKIVHVGAPTLKKATIYFDNINLKGEFTMMKAMGQEMLANHLMTQEFAKRIPASEMVLNIHHVGIAKTGIMRETGFFLKMLVNVFGTSPDKACANTVYLASDEKVNYSGYFLPKPGKPEVKTKIQFDAGMAAKLWDRSMELIKPVL
jgi:retinol dehydrogenase-14